MAARVLPAIEGVTIAHAAGPVALAGGLTVVARHGFADAPPCDVTIVCGGPGWRKQIRDAAMLAFPCAASIRFVSPQSAPARSSSAPPACSTAAPPQPPHPLFKRNFLFWDYVTG
jgi:transcriptional regulator GlxA family with amidase domain